MCFVKKRSIQLTQLAIIPGLYGDRAVWVEPGRKITTITKNQCFTSLLAFSSYVGRLLLLIFLFRCLFFAPTFQHRTEPPRAERCHSFSPSTKIDNNSEADVFIFSPNVLLLPPQSDSVTAWRCDAACFGFIENAIFVPILTKTIHEFQNSLQLNRTKQRG